ncbi:MAG: nucleotidyltransferase family protein [Thaumarchaeota archaeon]|nr:nucleotidyltransferase family protein [Nitrososphaerota archaeon]
MKPKVAAAVLCGGRGERLRPLTDFFQKTMIPIGERRRPLLEYIVRLLVHHGIRDITMLGSYRMKEIRDYFKEGSAFGARIAYSKDKKGERGSLSALAGALSRASIPKCDVLIVYYGDILSDLDITRLVLVHSNEKADATLVLSRGYTLPIGVATVRGGRRVVAMEEKPTLDLSITTGCMALGPRAMRSALEIAGKGRGDLMSDFVPELLKRKVKVAAYYTTGLWYDVGALTSYEKLNSELKDDSLSYIRDQPAAHP